MELQGRGWHGGYWQRAAEEGRVRKIGIVVESRIHGKELTRGCWGEKGVGRRKSGLGLALRPPQARLAGTPDLTGRGRVTARVVSWVSVSDG